VGEGVQVAKKLNELAEASARVLSIFLATAAALVIFGFPLSAQTTTQIRLYHLHAESSNINTTARALSQAESDAPATAISGPKTNIAGDKVIASFETQIGEPNCHYA
jgi:hypothetical protein